MRAKRMRLNNYGSFYGRHEFNLGGRGLVLIDGDNRDDPCTISNASGKSTLMEALDWCWYGEVPRKDDADSIVNEEAEKDTFVEVELEDEDGTELRVLRFRKEGKKSGKSGVRLFVNDVEQTFLDAKETQLEINRHLGMDRHVFKAAVMFSQFDRFNFAESTDAERVETLTKILQLETIDVWLAKAKALRDQAASGAAAAREEKVRAEAALDSSARILVEYGEQQGRWETERQTKLEDLAKSRAEVEQYLEETRPLVAGLERDRAALSQAEAARPAPPPEIAQAQAARDQAMQAAAGLNGEAQGFLRQAAEVEREVQRFGALKVGKCSTCGQDVTAEHLQAEVEARGQVAQSHVAAAEAKRQEAETLESEAAGHAAQLEQLSSLYDAELRAHGERVLELRQKVDAAANAQGYVHSAEQSLWRIDEDVRGWTAAVNPYVEKLAATQEERASLELRLGQLVQHAEALRLREAAFDYHVKACGPKGIKSYILDARLTDLTEAANRWVQLLTGGAIWVQFTTHGMTTKKTLSNKVEVKVFKYNARGTVTERGYRSWSGGEKGKVALGIDFGLAALVARRAHKRFDILILDELFRHLDGAGKEAVVEMLTYLRQEKSSIFVVEHDVDFADAFENRIVIVKEGGRSRITEGGNSETPKPRRAQRRTRRPVRSPVRTSGEA